MYKEYEENVQVKCDKVDRKWKHASVEIIPGNKYRVSLVHRKGTLKESHPKSRKSGRWNFIAELKTLFGVMVAHGDLDVAEETEEVQVFTASLKYLKIMS